MQLLLHIGMGKTGTSTLQNTFRSNADVLQEFGVLYPVALSRPNHNGLTCMFLPADALAREFRTPEYENLSAVRQFGADIWASVARSVRRSEAHTAVLSAEYLFHMKREYVELLRDRLHELFDEIRVVAYVRQPAAYYVSVIQQKVKASYKIGPPSRYKVHYRNRLTNYLHAFGNENVAVRAFDPSTLEGGCVVRDFLVSCVRRGDELVSKVAVKRVNESMSAEAMCILQDFRRHGWPDQNDVFANESKLVLTTLNKLHEQLPSTPPRLKPAFAAGLTRRHQAELDWLEKRFGVTFPGSDCDGDGDGSAEDLDGWTSQRLDDILDVQRAQIDRTLFSLLKELASMHAGTPNRG